MRLSILLLAVEAKLKDFFNDDTLVPMKFKILNNTVFGDKQLNLVIGNEFKDGYAVVKEYGTNKPYYKVSQSFSKKFNRDTRVLTTMDNKVISNLRTNFTYFMRHKLYAGNDTSKFVTRIARKVSIKTKLSFYVKDQLTGNSTYMFLQRDKLNDGARITIEPDNVPVLVGRIRFGKVDTERISNSEFILSVAKGFDSGFMVDVVLAFASSFDRKLSNY